MPSGRVHNLINTAAYSLIAGSVLWGVRSGLLAITPAQAASFTVAYMAGTFLLSPDLDLSDRAVDSKRNWGFLGFLWVPYGLVFSHRGLSHTWIVGPLTRLIYMLLIVAALCGLVLLVYPQWQWPTLPALRARVPSVQVLGFKFLLPALLGYYVSQWLHLIADGVRPDHGLRRSQQKLQQVRQQLNKTKPKHRRKKA